MASTKMKTKERAKPPAIPDLSELTRIEAPIIYAAAASAQATGNELILQLSRVRPTTDKTGAMSNVALVEPVALVYMSPQTAKDVSLILSDAVQKFEKINGTINTPFTASRSKNGKKKG